MNTRSCRPTAAGRENVGPCRWAPVLIAALVTWGALSTGSRAQRTSDPVLPQKPKVDQHTLFLAHFNQGFEADFARGDGKPLKRDNRGGALLAPGRFGRALSVPRGAFGIAYATEKNIDARQGTVEFWVRGKFPRPTAADPQKVSLPFFTAGCDQTGLGIFRSQYNHVGCVVNEGYKGTMSLVFSNAGENRIDDGKWHHLAVTWDAEHAALFLDGRRKAWTEKPVYPSVGNWTNGSMAVGYAIDSDYYYAGSSDKAGFVPKSAQGEIDELRISDVVRYVADFIPPDREF